MLSCTTVNKCDCLTIAGTGHTGPTPGYFAFSAYNDCVNACCEDMNINKCSIFLVDEDYGVKFYDPTTNLAWDLFNPSMNVTNSDIASWQNYIWVYNNTIIEEYYITFSPFTSILNRTISTGGQNLGKGLRALIPGGGIRLLSAKGNVKQVDLIMPPQLGGPLVPNPVTISSTAVVTNLFTIPSGDICLGDIYHSGNNVILVIYGNQPAGAPPANQKLGLFTMGGILIDEHLIDTAGLNFLNDEVVDSIFNLPQLPGTKCKIMVATNYARTFEVLQTPYLSLSPYIQTITQNATSGNISKIRGATTNADIHCVCPLVIPPSWNCIQSLGTCTDPGNGTGQYTGATGYNQCIADCKEPETSWNCIPAAYTNNCSGATMQLPYPTVNNATSAIDYIAMFGNGIQSNLFSTMTFGLPPGTVSQGTCFGSQGEILHRIAFISSSGVFSNTHYFSWTTFVMGTISAGIPGISLSSTYTQVQSAIHHATGEWVRVSVGKPCLCKWQDCECVEIQGTSGTYQSWGQCYPPCCDTEKGYNCEILLGCLQCTAGCQFTTLTASGPPFFGNALAECQAFCETEDWWDCLDNGTCIPHLPLGTVGQHPSYGACMAVCGEDCKKCCQNTQSPFQQVQLVPWLSPCKCPIGWIDVGVNCDDPCIQPQWACPIGEVWSWVYCDCVCPQNQSCLPGFHWSFTQCKCVPDTVGPQDLVLEGTEGEILVKISEYTSTPLKETTIYLFESINELETQRRRGSNLKGTTETRCKGCGGSDELMAVCLLNGCLSYKTYKKDNSGIFSWKPNDTYGAKSYNCIGGSCLEINGSYGMFKTYNECSQKCNIISSKGKIPTIKTKVPTISTEQKQVNKTSKSSEVVQPTTSVEYSFYVSEKTLNPITGDYQTACVPVNSLQINGFNSLEGCLNGGGSGWLTNNISSNIKVFGVNLPDNSYMSIPMCCTGYMVNSNVKLTQQSCADNCFVGDTWFPLFNINGISTTSNTNNEIPSLVSSRIVVATKSITNYKNRGYRKSNIYPSNSVRKTSGSILGHVDGITVYNTINGALEDAKNIGCSGYHTHIINNVTGYMACDSHSQSTDGGGPGWVGDYHGPTNLLTIKHVDGGGGPIHRCCPVTNQPGSPTWVSVNPCGGNNIYTGVPVLGSGCGPNPNAAGGASDPLWCCTYDLLVGPSDIELKEKIEKVGKSESGINIYEFDYKDKIYGEGRYRGVMAQEVPEASFRHEDGYLHVDYSQIDVSFEKVK